MYMVVGMRLSPHNIILCIYYIMRIGIIYVPTYYLRTTHLHTYIIYNTYTCIILYYIIYVPIEWADENNLYFTTV